MKHKHIGFQNTSMPCAASLVDLYVFVHVQSNFSINSERERWNVEESKYRESLIEMGKYYYSYHVKALKNVLCWGVPNIKDILLISLLMYYLPCVATDTPWSKIVLSLSLIFLCWKWWQWHLHKLWRASQDLLFTVCDLRFCQQCEDADGGLLVVVPCGCGGGYKCFGGTCCLHFQPCSQHVFLKCWYPRPSPHSVIT
jgi:hypothetical protein